MADEIQQAIEDACPKSKRVDGPHHSWRFDGDDPRIECVFCGDLRDALSGHVIRPAEPAQKPSASEPITNGPEAASDPHSGRAEATGEIPAAAFAEAARIAERRSPGNVKARATAYQVATEVWHSRDPEVAELRTKLEYARSASDDDGVVAMASGVEVVRLRDLVSRLSKRIEGLLEETERAGVCDCESYDPCYGECCGVGNCTCSTETEDDHA